MLRLAAFLLTAAALASAGAHAADLAVEVQSVESAGWRADGVDLVFAPPHDLQLRIAAVTVAGNRPLRNLRLRCRRLLADQGARCDDAAFRVTVPGWGTLDGRLQARFHNPQRWHAQLEVPRRQLHLVLDQTGTVLKIALRLQAAPAAGLHQLVTAMGFQLPGTSAGLLDLAIKAQLAGTRLTATAEISTHKLDYSEPSGRYAAEKLSARAKLHWDSAREHLDLALDTQGGQAYAEPLYFDFIALPLQVEGALTRAGSGWRVEPMRIAQGQGGSAGTLELSGLLDPDFKPVQLDAHLKTRNLAPLVATDVLPFLIGTRLDGLSAEGGADARFSMRGGAAHSLSASLSGVTVHAGKLGVSLEEISGELNWSASAAAATAPGSQLQWRRGAVLRVPLGASQIAFITEGRNFTLSAPWRQPLLGGALRVEQLVLREAGATGAAPLTAEFQGAVEPINLAALCKALGWPEFGGTLGGQLPGLTVRDEVWSIDGALEAQAFDGSVRIANLRAIQPFGRLPRVMADVQMRRLDLERLTGAFSFGRITGRLDGDISGLRLLNWSPVAFDGRLYSTPGHDGSQRISQRAIDNISRIGGGPTGLISRSFLNVFEDFAYARLGISCVLRDGVCMMDGVEPAATQDGLKAYYLVKGRLLPRINVVGYAQRVSWTHLIEQLRAAQASGGPELEK